MKKFPNLLHIRIEEERDGDPYFIVEEGGALGATDVVETAPMALYKLVSVGRIFVRRTFEAKPGK